MTLGRMQNPIRGFLHGGAALASVAGLVVLLERSWGSPRAVVGSMVYGVGLVAMFTVSSLYHSVPWSPGWKARLQRLDHAVIYLLVAGTFTPVAIAALTGWALGIALALVWTAGVTGIVLKMMLTRVATWLSVTLQITMGWAAVLFLPQIHERLGVGAIVLIALGGVAYTVGAIVFAVKRPRLLTRSFSYHELFHSLVVVAGVLHFVAVFAYALPVTVGS